MGIRWSALLLLAFIAQPLMAQPFPLAVALLLQASLGSPTASIEGTVVRAGANDPIARVEVMALPADGSSELPAVTTDAQGRFLIEGLKTGFYTLQADRNGFPPQRYGQRKPRGPATKLNLEPGQALKDIVFPLTPGSAISGRITDETGEPLLDVNVEINEPIYDGKGVRRFQTLKTGKTDDRGEYRIFLLPPGKYRMKATPNLMFNRGLSNPNYVATYYPGVSDASGAADINLDPGADVGGIDLVLHKQRLFTIRGRIVDSKTGMPPASPNFELEHRDSEDRVPLRPDYSPATGAFSLMNVPPGSYWIKARLYLYRVEGQTRLSSTNRLVRAAIDISADITDVLLQIPSDLSIAGSVAVDNGAAMADLPDVHGTVVGLNAKDNIGISLQVPIRPDGTFLIENVQPADYTVNVIAPHANYYIKAGRFEGNDIMNGFRVAATPSEPLTIVLGSDMAQVAGTILDGDHKPVSGVNAILIPTHDRERTDLYRTAATDQLGRFRLLPVVPGEYKLFAWEDDVGGAYGDAEFLRKYEELGTPVTVPPSGTLDIGGKVIDASR